MSTTEPLLVDCGPHGKRVAAVVCRHLLGEDKASAGFVENSDGPNDLQAWCHACEETFQREDGMTDVFREFNGMALVCVKCYAEAKARHTLPAH
nr:hypothetical protein [uncultured Rhodoferax sp.]